MADAPLATTPMALVPSGGNQVDGEVALTRQPQPPQIKQSIAKPSAGHAGASSTQELEPAGAVKIMRSGRKLGAEKSHPYSPASASGTQQSRYKFLHGLTLDDEYVKLLQAFKDMVCILFLTQDMLS
jgi:hypothetical protein